MLKGIKGIIFDYGGTLDTNSRHWAEVLWDKYKLHQVPVNKDLFRQAYVATERELAKQPHIRPDHNFLDVLRIKTRLQMHFLAQMGVITSEQHIREQYADKVAESCHRFVLDTLHITRPVVQELAHIYQLVLVSNFYGNIHTILEQYDLHTYFSHVVESAVVGVRKPDPEIYRLGVEAMGFAPEEVLVVGDSFSKDIVPAKAIGCKAVWLKGEGWGNEQTDNKLPDAIISSLEEIPELLPKTQSSSNCKSLC